ncbi:Flp pilus assembly complex ATPase component TadA [Candidatus Bathyarchaeota archaeon]|nr:Flp pilus assembly complex ATPase component TadA [Candidatus Bathyarchaeota archaeon]
MYLPDEIAVESGLLSRLMLEGRIKGRILIHSSIVKYIENKALRGDFRGIRELENARKIAEERGVSFELLDGDPNLNPKRALRELALKTGSTIVTADIVSAMVAKALGIKVLYGRNHVKIRLADFFKEGDVMSVHLKENLPPRVKRGMPGKWVFETIGDKALSREEIEELVNDILDRARAGEGFIETDKEGSTIIQLGDYRIVITRPPFSDGLEITAVRPIVHTSLDDYGFPPKLLRRLEKQAEGILIAGAPGMGKSTFAQALAEFYLSKGKIVKTIEAPRDLQLPDEVTQYSKVRGDSQEIHDVLLLSRPDYTIFDEMRDTEDFKLYSDLRLSGVGMIGVVHATTAVDAIQRFIGRVELGVIPSIIDTVIFIRNGGVEKVYSIENVVKIPHGLKDADLARPVVVIKDFLTGEPEYEMYVFGEKTFVIPVKRRSRREKIVSNNIETLLQKYTYNYKVETEGNTLIVRIPIEVYSVISRRCLRKLERIGRRAGFTQVSIEIMEQT